MHQASSTRLGALLCLRRKQLLYHDASHLADGVHDPNLHIDGYFVDAAHEGQDFARQPAVARLLLRR